MPSENRKQLKKLAIVPAYNEEGMVGRVVRDICLLYTSPSPRD